MKTPEREAGPIASLVQSLSGYTNRAHRVSHRSKRPPPKRFLVHSVFQHAGEHLELVEVNELLGEVGVAELLAQGFGVGVADAEGDEGKREKGQSGMALS